MLWRFAWSFERDQRRPCWVVMCYLRAKGRRNLERKRRPRWICMVIVAQQEPRNPVIFPSHLLQSSGIFTAMFLFLTGHGFLSLCHLLILYWLLWTLNKKKLKLNNFNQSVLVSCILFCHSECKMCPGCTLLLFWGKPACHSSKGSNRFSCYVNVWTLNWRVWQCTGIFVLAVVNFFFFQNINSSILTSNY